MVLGFYKAEVLPNASAYTGALGADGQGLAKIRVTLSETDLARAVYEGSVT